MITCGLTATQRRVRRRRLRCPQRRDRRGRFLEAASGPPVIVNGNSMGAAAACSPPASWAPRPRLHPRKCLSGPQDGRLEPGGGSPAAHAGPRRLRRVEPRLPLFLPNLDEISPLKAIAGIPEDVPVLLLSGGGDHLARPTRPAPAREGRVPRPAGRLPRRRPRRPALEPAGTRSKYGAGVLPGGRGGGSPSDGSAHGALSFIEHSRSSMIERQEKDGGPRSVVMAAQLKSIRIRNYRSLANVTLNLKPVNVLFGPNGAGKSTLLDTVWFIRIVPSEASSSHLPIVIMASAFCSTGPIRAARSTWKSPTTGSSTR